SEMAVFWLAMLDVPAVLAAIDAAPRLDRVAPSSRAFSTARRASSVPETFGRVFAVDVEAVDTAPPRPRRASATSSGRGSGRWHTSSKKACAIAPIFFAYLRSPGAHSRARS